MKPNRGSSDTVAIILAVGVALALNIITCALMYAALSRLVNGSTIGLSENGTQLLTGWGGTIGVLGSYIGFTFGKRNGQATNGFPGAKPPKPREPPPT